MDSETPSTRTVTYANLHHCALAGSGIFAATAPAMAPPTPSAAATPTNATPTPPTAPASPATPTTPAEGKKKRQGLFAAKTKQRLDNSPGFLAGEASPVRPRTPKVPKVLGVPLDIFGSAGKEDTDGDRDPETSLSEDEPDLSQFLQSDGSEDEGRSGRPGSSGKNAKATAGIQSKFREEGLEPDPPASSKKGSMKAFRMLNFIPSFSPRGKSSRQVADPEYRDSDEDEDIDVPYSSGLQTQGRSQIQRRPAQRRRRKKKGPKPLAKMSTITEVSFSESGSVVSDDRDDDELELISPYKNKRASRSVPSMFSRSMTTSVLPRSPSPYDFKDDDLSPDELPSADEFPWDEPGGQQDLSHVQGIFGKVPDYNRTPGTRRARLQVRSPLQEVEHRLLDEAEEMLESLEIQPRTEEQDVEKRRSLLQERRKSLLVDEERMRLDAENLLLREDHIKMKQDFRGFQARSIIQEEPVPVGPEFDHEAEEPEAEDHEVDEDETDSASHCSISSSIDLDEEPVVCMANVVSVTRVSPGMVKLVDIPPRKQEVNAAPMAKPTTSERQGIYSFRGSDLLGFPTEEGEKGDVRAKRLTITTTSRTTSRSHSNPFDLEQVPNQRRASTAIADRSEDEWRQVNHEQLEPFPPYVDGYYGRFPKPEKPKLSQEESRLMVQDWLSTYDSAEQQRPLSVQFDPAVMAERQIPPPPLPKEDVIPKTPKNHCIIVGHKFRPIDLNKVPDDATVGDLEVRPYLETHTGRREHVYVPVMCDKCGADVKENFWECERPSCHLALCWDCHLEQQFEAWSN